MTRQISLMVLASNTGIGRERESYWHYNEKCVLISTPCRGLLSTLRIFSLTDLLNDKFRFFQCSHESNLKISKSYDSIIQVIMLVHMTRIVLMMLYTVCCIYSENVCTCYAINATLFLCCVNNFQIHTFQSVTLYLTANVVNIYH